MSKPATKTKILDDGLRYKSKAGGSPFKEDKHFAQATMSCFLCGVHRPRALLTSRKFIGKVHLVCAPSCRQAKEADAAAQAPDIPTVPT